MTLVAAASDRAGLEGAGHTRVVSEGLMEEVISKQGSGDEGVSEAAK